MSHKQSSRDSEGESDEALVVDPERTSAFDPTAFDPTAPHPTPGHGSDRPNVDVEQTAEITVIRHAVIVTVEGDLADQLPRLRAAGLRIERTMTTIGVVVGSISESEVPALERLSGVTVEEEVPIHLPPPGEPP